MILAHAAVIGGSILAGALIGATVGHRFGCYSTWRLVTWRMTHDELGR